MSGDNIRYGLLPFGRLRYAEPVRFGTAGGDEGGGTLPPVLPDDKIAYLPGVYAVIAYAQDGTKTAIYGAGAQDNALERATFEMVDTGCGAFELVFRELPAAAVLNYRQRVDIHLFNDPRPWYSGYVIARPVEGTTATEYKVSGHGFYNLLEKVIINATYKRQEVAAIVADIAREVEQAAGLAYNRDKIIDTGYTVEQIEFDHVTAKEALKQLSDFAAGYVYGVDEYRELYFAPRVTEINEQGRLWVGQHVGQYLPVWNVEKIVNKAYIKGGKLDDVGKQWLATVEDKESQQAYGLQAAVWSLPSAYSAEDAERWGRNQLDRYKGPTKEAKLEGLVLEYPKPSGEFFVRKLTPQGQAAITTLDGAVHTYPISGLKYTISGAGGIAADMTLGEPAFKVDRYLFNIERGAKVAELMQQAAAKQLKLEALEQRG